MKLHLLYISLYFASFTLLVSSCASPEYKTDDAFVTVKEDKDSLGDSIASNIVVIQEPKKEEQLVKIEFRDDWIKFKIEIEKRITKNEIKIKEIASTSQHDNKLLKKAESLREDNTQLRRKLYAFEDEIKTKREKFKIELNNDLIEASDNIKDISKGIK